MHQTGALPLLFLLGKDPLHSGAERNGLHLLKKNELLSE